MRVVVALGGNALLKRGEPMTAEAQHTNVRGADGKMEGVEAVIDKDRTAALPAKALKADVLLMLADVEAVFRNLGGPDQAAIGCITPDALDAMEFAAGSIGPKITTACDFVRAGGRLAGIGRLQDARVIVDGRAGTQVRLDTS